MKAVTRIALQTVAIAGQWLATRRDVRKMIFNAIRLNRPEMNQLMERDELRFISYCFARRAMSRSQIMQDLWVCFELNEKRYGFFVEFGATNGLKNSNTWLLEKEFGWNGILSEPNPVWHEDLAANRQVAIEHKCIASRSGETVSFITTNQADPELSAIADFSSGDHFADVRSRGNRIELETMSLDDLLNVYNAPAEIDYISIDTEGSEYDILSAYSFSRRFKLLSIEKNASTEKPIQDLLESKGYVRVFPEFSQWDGWYVAKELRSGKKQEIFAPPS